MCICHYRLVCVCSSSGSVHVLQVGLNFDVENQPCDMVREFARFELGGDIFSSPVMIGGEIFVGCRDDNVHCIRLQEEIAIWAYYILSFTCSIYGSIKLLNIEASNIGKEVSCKLFEPCMTEESRLWRNHKHPLHPSDDGNAMVNLKRIFNAVWFLVVGTMCDFVKLCI